MLKDEIRDSEKKIKIILIVIVVICIVRYIVYLFTYHEFCSSEMLLFTPLDEQGFMMPSYTEEDINAETGMVEITQNGSSWSPAADKAIVTIKGELCKGSAHYIMYSENGDVLIDILLEAGIEYDETYELYDVGTTVTDYFEFEPETEAFDDGLLITFTGMKKD